MAGWVVVVLLALALSGAPKIPPNAPPWIKRLWPLFTKYSAKYDVPLGLAVGWVNHESSHIGPGGTGPGDPVFGGRSSDWTGGCNERGYFQIMGDHAAGTCPGDPEATDWAGSEAGQLGLTQSQFTQLSINSDFSMAWGFALAARYAQIVQSWGVARGSEFFWRMVKLCHTFGHDHAYRLYASAGGIQDWGLFTQVNGKYPQIDEVIAFGRQYGPVTG